MSRSFEGWAPYVPRGAPPQSRTRDGEAPQERRRALAGEDRGTPDCQNVLGQGVVSDLESYRDYENRLPRGRTYVRNGLVVDLQIATCEVTAIVSGSKIYKVKVSIGDVARPAGRRFALTVRAGSTPWWNCCKGDFPKG